MKGIKRKMKLNIGCGEDYKEGYINVDTNPEVKRDVDWDITKKSDFASGSASEIYCWNVLEHIHDPMKALQEFYRILKVGGKVIFRVPMGGSITSYSVIDHVHQFHPLAFVRQRERYNYKFEPHIWITFPFIHFLKFPYWLSYFIPFFSGIEGTLIKEEPTWEMNKKIEGKQ